MTMSSRTAPLILFKNLTLSNLEGNKAERVFYGSLYVTLCFVLCPFDFGVLTIEFSVLCTMLHILNGALHVVEQRWRTNEERKTRV